MTLPPAGSSHTSVSLTVGFWPRLLTKFTFPLTVAAATGMAHAIEAMRTMRFMGDSDWKNRMVAWPLVHNVCCYLR